MPSNSIAVNRVRVNATSSIRCVLSVRALTLIALSILCTLRSYSTMMCADGVTSCNSCTQKPTVPRRISLPLHFSRASSVARGAGCIQRSIVTLSCPHPVAAGCCREKEGQYRRAASRDFDTGRIEAISQAASSKRATMLPVDVARAECRCVMHAHAREC